MKNAKVKASTKNNGKAKVAVKAKAAPSLELINEKLTGINKDYKHAVAKQLDFDYNRAAKKLKVLRRRSLTLAMSRIRVSKRAQPKSVTENAELVKSVTEALHTTKKIEALLIELS